LLAEEELLTEWGKAYRARLDRKATHNLAGARWIAEELAEKNSDYLLRDAVAAIESADPDRLSRLALGHELYGRALALYAASRSEEALGGFTAAAVAWRETGSPFLYWAEVYRAICLYYAENRSSSLAALAGVRALASGRPYPILAARVAWMMGLNFVETGRAEAALAEYAQAVANFRRCRELENVLALETMIAVVYDYLGERQEAWRHWAAALKLQPHARFPRRLHSLFDTAASSVARRLPETALYFQTEVLRIARVEGPLEETVALWRRALLLAQVGRLEEARADLVAARRTAAAIPGKLRSSVDADIAMAEGYVESSHRPHLADERLTRALQLYVQEDYRQELAHLHGQRARVRLALDRPQEAERDFAAAIEEYERQRSITSDPRLQISYFDQGVDLYGELAALQASRSYGAAAAFYTLERRKARQLLDNVRGALQESTPSSLINPLQISQIQRELPAGTALVSYAIVGSDLLCFLVRRDRPGVVMVRTPAESLATSAERVVRWMGGGGREEKARELLALLFDRLLKPIERSVRGVDTLVFVPDGALHVIPWAALYDRNSGRYLVQSHRVIVAPSASVFALGSQRWRTISREPVAAVALLADPAFDARKFSLRRLPSARHEAERSALLYQAAGLDVTVSADERATPAALRAALAESDIIGVAAHFIMNRDRPDRSVLLLAGADGALSPSALRSLARGPVRAVLLGTCDSGAGAVSATEGTLSLARAVLAAGIPSVLATLWPIEDKESEEFFHQIHRALARGSSPPDALRSAQLEAIRGAPAGAVHRWAAVQALGAG
jgi:CHAT domain-containing protein